MRCNLHSLPYSHKTEARLSTHSIVIPVSNILVHNVQYMGFASFSPGDTVFNQGDTGDHFYIILSGAVDVLVCEDEESTMEVQVWYMHGILTFVALMISSWHVTRNTGSCFDAFLQLSFLLADMQDSGASASWSSIWRAGIDAGTLFPVSTPAHHITCALLL